MGRHLQRCLVYIDLNMVRAGAVRHPGEWVYGGYHEIQGNKCRNTIIDQSALMDALKIGSIETLRSAHAEWIEEALSVDIHKREDSWSQSVAVGSVEFTLRAQTALGLRGRKRDVAKSEDMYLLRETEENYGPAFGVKNRPIAPKNMHLWDILS